MLKYEHELGIISGILRNDLCIVEEMVVRWRHEPNGSVYEFMIGPATTSIKCLDTENKEMWAS
jgi:hypothetical protein